MSLIFGSLGIASAELIDNGDGTVTQIRNDGSRLMWLKNANTAGVPMIWAEVNAWIDNLNSINYLNYNDWRLPVAIPLDPNSGHNMNLSCDGSSDIGYNIISPNSDMSYMYYVSHLVIYLSSFILTLRF